MKLTITADQAAKLAAREGDLDPTTGKPDYISGFVPSAADRYYERRLAALHTKLATYEEILRVVCGHLELPQSESGPTDDVRLYDRALEAADEYTKQADADLAVNRAARFKAEAEVERLRIAADYISPYLRWTISSESPGYAPTMPSAVAAFHVAFDIDTEAKRAARMRVTIPTSGGDHG